MTTRGPSCLPQKFHASARIRSPNVIRAHGFEDRLVGIAQERSGFGITSTRQAFAEAARKDRVLNFVLAMFAIKLQGTSKFALGQLKFSGGHVNLCTQLIETCQIRFSGRPSYGCDLRPGSLKLPFRLSRHLLFGVLERMHLSAGGTDSGDSSW